jgi:hypothetical protein
MSDTNTGNTEQKSERSNLLAWVGSLAALIAAIGGLATLVENLHSAGLIGSKAPIASSSSPSVEFKPSSSLQEKSTSTNINNSGALGNQQFSGELKVDADNPLGTRFANEQSSPQTYMFYATGEWTYNGQLDLRHSADGHSSYPNASDRYRLKGFPEGALIVEKEDGTYKFIGSIGELTLAPGEFVLFTINDIENGESFGDNGGSLTVRWSCKTCK